jgi:hypothetical protein
MRTAITCLLRRAQNLIDEALAAAAIADASQSDPKIFIAAVHGCGPKHVFLA